MKKKTVAIVTVYKNAYSETFIKAQIDELKIPYVLYGGWFPKYYNNDNPILSRWKLRVNEISNVIFKKELFNSEINLIRFFKKYKIEVIIIQYGPAAAILYSACVRAGLPYVVHFHGFDAYEYEVLKDYRHRYEAVFKSAKHIIAVSNDMKNKLISLGCCENKIKLVTYGPNNLFFKAAPKYENITFLSVGRFVEKKAPYLTLIAFKNILTKFPEAQLKMVGDGELLGVCINLVKAWNIEKNVSFLGVLNSTEIMLEMEKSLAFIQHSVVANNGDSEGTPVAIIEAQAAALPVVSTRHAGISDIVVDKETGFLVNEFDVKGMSEAMTNLIENKNLARSLGENGRLRILKNYTMEQYIQNLKNILE